ncbi:Na+/H+ antiporter subunit C [Pyxidicoccus fallax]|uniref:Na+/H+ antiporter subunit C n=1 Tax=Pyxidicoccus fallax TaxID=394095 RepID=A0A848LLS5_9BACT|nr:Na+/H+ antiporter subunit C [Pyxidicoccus fallax]NMO18649.1 Na+/H+ antiporter subunit C [Pyxidicoccus fallax]NPC79054.1 Na+/H+ antiporter subunit C [Pyxidicoccus fallax]
MEVVLAVAIGILAGSGVWLLLRPRTFQLVIGLSLLSYAVNLFIFSIGGLAIDKEPILADGVPPDLAHYTDPVPQALVLTAIVISFAMTALLLVITLASRGMTGTDHVDGTEV